MGPMAVSSGTADAATACHAQRWHGRRVRDRLPFRQRRNVVFRLFCVDYVQSDQRMANRPSVDRSASAVREQRLQNRPPTIALQC